MALCFVFSGNIICDALMDVNSLLLRLNPSFFILYGSGVSLLILVTVLIC